MIRNNKALATDLQGNKLFQPTSTESINYAYSTAEADFYRTMSAFILDGRAYALSLSGRQQTARMLLLIALQKLAASSIAAIRRALERRRDMLKAALPSAVPGVEEDAETLDDAAEAEENRPSKLTLLLLKDEIERLDEIIGLSRQIEHESKIARLLGLIEERLASDEPLLLFTEYKATQALVFAALENQFGRGCVGFINGDERLIVPAVDGSERVLNLSRDTAAADFNCGRTRFLIATEAGGEGIDLQERCATLVHVDLPWNPMRLHQRVGRLNRYGQKRAVQVFLLRNPQTVEARIWALLEEKLERIQGALSASMEEAEDITQLVIGMTGNRFFDELFSDAGGKGIERLSDWFDARTQQFGGRDAVETVRGLIGRVARYDFQSVGADIPKLDLPALESFFRHAMQLNGRRVTRSEEGLSVATPEIWRASIDFRPRYDGLVLNRALPHDRALIHLLGVGHPLIDRALAECGAQEVYLARLKGLENPLLVALVEDEVTGTHATVHRVVLSIEAKPDGSASILRDWQALLRINELQPPSEDLLSLTPAELAGIERLKDQLGMAILPLALPFQRPKVTPVLALLPALPEEQSEQLGLERGELVP
jgi:hypothetical protein